MSLDNLKQLPDWTEKLREDNQHHASLLISRNEKSNLSQEAIKKVRASNNTVRNSQEHKRAISTQSIQRINDYETKSNASEQKSPRRQLKGLGEAKGSVSMLLDQDEMRVPENIDGEHENPAANKTDYIIEQLHQSQEFRKSIINSQEKELESMVMEFENLKQQIQELEEAKRSQNRIIKTGNQELAEKEADIELIEDKLKRKHHEIEDLLNRNDEMKTMMNELSERYKDIVNESTFITAREKDILEKLREKDEIIENNILEMKAEKKKMQKLQDELETLTARNLMNEKKIQTLEREELQLITQSQAQTSDYEELVFERDAARKKSQALLQQLESLQIKFNEQPKIYQEKNELAQQTMRTQFNLERRKFCEETDKLQDLVSNLQSQVDRAIREKRAAESELDKLIRHIPAETDRMTMVLEEMHSKLQASEKERHDAIQRLESLYTQQKQDQTMHDLEIHQANERLEANYRRLRRVENEFEQSKKQEVALAKANSSLEHEKVKLNDQLKNIKMSHESEIKQIQNRYESRIEELESKLQNVTEANSTANKDLQRLLGSQKQMTEKWNDESQQIRDKYDQILRKAQLEIAQYQNRQREMETKYQSARAQIQDLVDQMTKEKRIYAHLHQRFVNAEKSLAQAANQIKLLNAKETDLLTERKNLKKENDKLQIEVDSLRLIQTNQSHRTFRSPFAELHDPELNDTNKTKQLEQDIERIKTRTKKRNIELKRFDLDDSD